MVDTVAKSIAALVGPEHVRPATEVDAIDGVKSQLVVEPATSSEVAGVLAIASRAGQHVIPRGGGTKLSWGSSPATAEVVLSTCRLNRLLEHADGDMTATVEAGCTIDELQRRLAGRGQRLALDPLWPQQATVGGVFATGDSGSLRNSFGPARDLILGVTVALADGTLARSGGKVVKNVAGYDLPKLMTGSYGTLGVITQVTVRLHPLPAVVRNMQFQLSEQNQVEPFVTAMRECSLLTTAVQFEAGTDLPTVAQIRVEGASQVIDAKCQRIARGTADAGIDSPTEIAMEDWTARESLFVNQDSPALVCKVSLLPARLPAWLELLRRTGTAQDVRWRFLGQLAGVGLLRLESPQSSNLLHTVETLRTELAEQAGSLVILSCPAGLKSQADIWGDASDSQPLRQQVKMQFDETNTLNPGRYVGGI